MKVRPQEKESFLHYLKKSGPSTGNTILRGVTLGGSVWERPGAPRISFVDVFFLSFSIFFASIGRYINHVTGIVILPKRGFRHVIQVNLF